MHVVCSQHVICYRLTEPVTVERDIYGTRIGHYLRNYPYEAYGPCKEHTELSELEVMEHGICMM